MNVFLEVILTANYLTLLIGLAYNLLISIAAMGIGTLIGWGLARLRFSYGLKSRIALMLTTLVRNVPSFVLMFFIAFVLPTTITIGLYTFEISASFKAALALSVPVAGFCSDQFLAHLKVGQSEKELSKQLLANAWVQYLVIILMASSTASAIGAPELLYQINDLIQVNPGVDQVLALYCLAALMFITTAALLNALLKIVLRNGFNSQSADRLGSTVEK